MQARVLRFVSLAALVAGILTLTPVAQGRNAVTLKLYVTFSVSGDISMSLPDGTPVGTTKGAPTVIPAGYYTVNLSQPGCIDVPDFNLQGPGVKILDNLDVGEDTTKDFIAVFQPNSTYTWRNDSVTPVVVHTFVTSGDILGTPPAPGTPVDGYSAPPVTSHKIQTNGSLVGSGVVPFRGTLSGAVSAAGKLTVVYKGKGITRLTAGRYTISVVDKSPSSGFLLEKGKHAVTVTGAAFVGKHSGTINLTAGRWAFAPRLGTTTFSVIVH